MIILTWNDSLLPKKSDCIIRRSKSIDYCDRLSKVLVMNLFVQLADNIVFYRAQN